MNLRKWKRSSNTPRDRMTTRKEAVTRKCAQQNASQCAFHLSRYCMYCGLTRVIRVGKP